MQEIASAVFVIRQLRKWRKRSCGLAQIAHRFGVYARPNDVAGHRTPHHLPDHWIAICTFTGEVSTGLGKRVPDSYGAAFNFPKVVATVQKRSIMRPNGYFRVRLLENS
jgi:hypothetical protein